MDGRWEVGDDVVCVGDFVIWLRCFVGLVLILFDGLLLDWVCYYLDGILILSWVRLLFEWRGVWLFILLLLMG